MWPWEYSTAANTAALQEPLGNHVFEVNYNVKEEHFQVFEKASFSKPRPQDSLIASLCFCQALMVTLREGLGDLFTKVQIRFAGVLLKHRWCVVNFFV